MKVIQYLIEKFGHQLIALYVLTAGIVLSCITRTAPVGHDLIAAGLIAVKLGPLPVGGYPGQNQVSTETKIDKEN